MRRPLLLMTTLVLFAPWVGCTPPAALPPEPPKVGVLHPEQRELADGRIYSGAQAKSVGLVDDLGGLADATRAAWEQGGQTGEPRVVRERMRRRPWWASLLSETVFNGAFERAAFSGGLMFLYQGPFVE